MSQRRASNVRGMTPDQVPDPDVARFVLTELPAPPARVIEIGAGNGALAREMRSRGYDVLAIDPAAASGDGVEPVALNDVAAADATFDAAVAVVSLHHVEPLSDSFRRLAEIVRPGGILVVDEFDVARLDERAARWWLARRAEHDHHEPGPAELVAQMRDHIHSVRELTAALEPWFELSDATLGPYLYRWNLPPGYRREEEDQIASGSLPATGVRFTGTRT
jgi:SAM-dependent methyltransferase